MLRKIVFALVALALPLVAASAASAQQYPPSGDGTTPSVESPPVESGAGSASPAPLARSGTDLTIPATVAVLLLVGGTAVVVLSRRRNDGLPA